MNSHMKSNSLVSRISIGIRNVAGNSRITPIPGLSSNNQTSTVLDIGLILSKNLF
jgi:hypothetical protein